MKSATVLHNPKAGGGAFSRKRLMSLIRSAGFDCSYSSTKNKSWAKIEAGNSDFVVLAGGDGTIRKVAGKLLGKNIPIGVLPLGTANNIAKTLGIHGGGMAIEDIVNAWSDKQIKTFDVGRIKGLKKYDFFLEGIGFGVFPRLMKEMHLLESKNESAKEITNALEVLHDIILGCKSRQCRIEIDGADHSGKFILVEIMNTQAIGPNLNLAPFADPGDGEFEVVLISERQRQDFADYVLNKINGVEAPPIFNILKAKNLKISWEGKLMHVDDRIVQQKKSIELDVKLQPGVLKFLVTEHPHLANGGDKKQA